MTVHPYREPPEPERPERSVEDRDDEILYGLLVVIGMIPVAIAVARRTEIGAQATIGLVMAVGGIASLIAGWRTRRKRRARARRD